MKATIILLMLMFGLSFAQASYDKSAEVKESYSCEDAEFGSQKWWECITNNGD